MWRILILLCVAGIVGAQSIPIADLGPLTFQPGANVSSRLEFPRPQITCRGGQCPKTPDVIECTPVVEDSGVSWDCDGGSGWEEVLGRSFISCEDIDADSVLSGSCSIDLDMRDKKHQLPHPADDVAFTITTALGLVVVVFIFVMFCVSPETKIMVMCFLVAPFLLLYWGVVYHFRGSRASFCDQLQPTRGKVGSVAPDHPVPPNDVGFDPPPPPFDAPFQPVPPPTYDSVVG